MTPSRITILATLLAISSAIQGAFDDIPSQCQSVCSSLAEVSSECETLAGSDNTDPYLSCVCDGQGAATAIPLCEACVHQIKVELNPNQGPREWSQNDANRLLIRCSFDRIKTYNLESPSSTIMVAAYTSVVSGSTIIPTTDSRDSTSETITDAGDGPSATGAAGAASPTISESSSSHVQNLAAMPSMGAQGVSFIAGIGLLMAAAIL